jgi:hypothetical protein
MCSSLETCSTSDGRARIASSAALRRFRGLLWLISKTAARYSSHHLLPIIIGLLGKDCSRSLVVHGSVFIEARESVEADVAMKATERANTDDYKKVALDCTAPMRTRRLDASALGQLRFVPISIPSRRTASEVWPNRERSRNPSPESPLSVLGSRADHRSERESKQYGELCITICTRSHVARRLACHFPC